MKKLILTVFIALSLFASMLAFTSCDEQCVHQWGEWSISKISTCEEQGTKQRKCTLCEEIQVDYIDVAQHNYDLDNIVWTWDGNSSAVATLYCVTDSTHTRQIKANITNEITTSVTCTTDGVKAYTAVVKIDGITYTDTKREVILAKGHTEVICEAVEPTCSKEGLTEGKKCSACNEIFVAQQIVEKIQHTETVLEAVEATCLKEGLTEGKACIVCKEVIVTQKPIQKLNHTIEIITGKEATCYETGLTEGEKCSVCKEILKEQAIISKLPCNYKSEEIAPTCEDEGYTIHVCSMCGDNYTDDYKNATGHQWGEWKISGENTIRNCINKGDCTKYQRIISISATYNGIRLLTGEAVWREDVAVIATLADSTTIAITDFTLENDVMQNDGSNCVVVNFKSLSTNAYVPAIYANLDGTTSASEFTYEENNDAITITGFIGNSTNIVIPAHINRVPVRYINEYAFNGHENIKSVVIPNSIFKVGAYAFNNCKRMISLTLGKGLTFLDIGAFANCISLTSLNIPANVLTLESPYWSDDFGVFENCTALTKVTIGNNELDIAEAVIGKRAFQNCFLLNELIIGNNVKVIDESSFNGCTSLTTLTIGLGVENINAYAFNNCENLKIVAIPDSVTKIGSYAFNNCKRMTSLTLGKGLTFLDIGVFANCISLTTVDIPANVLTLESPYWSDDFGAFENCTTLTKVTIGEDTVDVAETVIGKRAFKNCTSLVELYIGNKVKIIGESSFEGCAALTTLMIGSGVQEIHAYAFNNCEAMTSVIIPDGVLTIGSHAFNNCKKMTSLSLGKGLKYLDIGAFANCISLTSLNIPANVLTLESPYWSDDFGVFENCTGLVKVIIGDDTVDIPEATIGERTFKGCTALEEVYIGSNVKTISDSAFEGCIYLDEINFGTGVQSVGSYAFADCTRLTSITIPNNVISLGNNVFNDCVALNDVTIEKGKERIRSFGSDVFYGCSNLERLYYTGTSNDWSEIAIDENNCYPLNLTPYYYNASKPNLVGNYWYYNGDGLKRVWNVSDVAFNAQYSSESFLELFGGEDSSYSTTFYKSLEDASDFKSGLYMWEALHLIADTSFSEGVWKVSKKDLYKLVIYDLLCGEANAQENLNDYLNVSKNAYVDDLIKDIFGKEVTSNYLKSLPCSIDYNPKILEYNIIGLNYILETSSNMYEAIHTCATYLVLSDMDKSFQQVLLQIANDDSNPYELREAANEYAEIYKLTMEEILLNFALQYSTSDERALIKVVVDVLWDKTVELVFPAFGIAQTVAKGILFLADLGLNVDAKYMAYYKLEVAVNLEASLRKIINNTLPDYFRVSNRLSAEKYAYVIDLYKTSVLLGFDYSNTLLLEDSKKINISEEEKQAYISTMNTISSLKQNKKELYEQFEKMISQAYVRYYQ